MIVNKSQRMLSKKYFFLLILLFKESCLISLIYSIFEYFLSLMFQVIYLYAAMMIFLMRTVILLIYMQNLLSEIQLKVKSYLQREQMTVITILLLRMRRQSNTIALKHRRRESKLSEIFISIVHLDLRTIIVKIK